MTMMHTSRRTDVPTADYYSLQTEWKLHHCVTDVRRQYPIAPLFRGDLVHVQTMCTRLSLRDSQNVSRGESGNEATDRCYYEHLITCQLFAGSCALSYSHHRHHGSIGGHRGSCTMRTGFPANHMASYTAYYWYEHFTYLSKYLVSLAKPDPRI